MRETLVSPHLARLEPQAGEPVAADQLVTAAGGRDEHEPARAGPWWRLLRGAGMNL